MRVSGSTTAFGRLPWPQMPAQFHPEPRRDVRRAVQSPDTDKPFFEKRTEPPRAAADRLPASTTATKVDIASRRSIGASSIFWKGRSRFSHMERKFGRPQLTNHARRQVHEHPENE